MKATKAQRAAMEKRRAGLDAAREAVWGANVEANRNQDMSFATARMKAPAEIRDRHRAAEHAVDDYERELISAGRAWRSPSGGFYFNET